MTKRDRMSYRRNSRAHSEGNLFLIIVEGRVTEKKYFNDLRTQLRLSGTHIKVLPGTDSDPMHMVDFAKRKVQERERDRSTINYDHIWLVFDTESPDSGRNWQGACQAARQNNFSVALSSPCFELWYILHHKYTSASMNDKRTALSMLREYDSRYDGTNVDNYLWLLTS